MSSKRQIITEHYNNVKVANTESAKKELFKSLLVRLFPDDNSVQKIIDKMSLGAEKTILNIPYKTHTKTGYVDTQYSKVIIEFKKNLKKNEEDAKEQLIEYLVGNWKSGQEYLFTLIATDCIRWKIYAPSYEDILQNKDIGDIEISEVDNFELTEKTADEYFYFLDRYLFRTEKQFATLEHIKKDFGDTSGTFLTVIAILKKQFDKVKEMPEVKNSFEQWHRFLSIAYGSFKASEEIFLVHTYLSVFSKILAYTIISQEEYIGDDKMKDIIAGNIFHELNIDNFIENDFYYWVSLDGNFKSLKPVFRKIAQQISQYDFTTVDEDIFKGIYQELVDLETRHALGEYYTPDWLCEKVVDNLPIKKNSTILDPACGSGSFLRIAINRLKSVNPKLSATQLAQRVVGIDIHPLSVQIAKNTVLLALGNKIRSARKPIILRVYLANTLLSPEGSVKLFGNEYKLMIDNEAYHIDTKIFQDANLFDEAINICDQLSEITKSEETEKLTTFSNIIRKRLIKYDLSDDTIVKNFHKIYIGIKKTKEQGRDSIWKFILQNLYKPFFLKGSFDFVVGNPPWLTYKDVTNKEYQDDLLELADKYKNVPKRANMPHLEIGVIFLAHSASYFLKNKGEIAFVLPRSLLTADQHDNLRKGLTKGYRITTIWDLKDISPLFRIPSCVVFGEKYNKIKVIRKEKIETYKGLKISGRIKEHDSSLKNVQDLLTIRKTKWHYVKLGRSSALSDKVINISGKLNYFQKHFKQGATVVPRNFYFVDIAQDQPPNWEERTLLVKTSEDIIPDSKKPWKELTLTGRIYSKFLFRTAISKNIVPFGLINPPLVVLPIGTDQHGRNQIRLYNNNYLKEEGYLDTASWFKKIEKLWNKNKTEKNRNISSIDYLNWQKKLTGQDLSKRYLIIYTASGKDANATIIDREKLDLTFIVESKTYWYGTNNEDEAYYLTSFLNANYPNSIIKTFQTLGLFGPRDIHKRILEIPFSFYKPKDPDHQRLAELGKDCEIKVSKYLSSIDDDYNVGTLRLQIRKILSNELIKIDKVLKRIIV